MATLQETKQRAKELGVPYTNSDTKAQIQKRIDKHILNEQVKSGSVPKEKIQEWKRKHKVYEISVEVSENDIAIGYLREPKRDEKALALSMYNQHQILETGEFLIQQCWLAGDERLKTDADIYEAAAIQAKNCVNFLKGSARQI